MLDDVERSIQQTGIERNLVNGHIRRLRLGQHHKRQLDRLAGQITRELAVEQQLTTRFSDLFGRPSTAGRLEVNDVQRITGFQGEVDPAELLKTPEMRPASGGPGPGAKPWIRSRSEPRRDQRFGCFSPPNSATASSSLAVVGQSVLSRQRSRISFTSLEQQMNPRLF